MTIRTLYFEDHGQDFLEWDVADDGFVLDSRPFQASVWVGNYVDVIEDEEGKTWAEISGWACSGVSRINYPVARIELDAWIDERPPHLGPFTTGQVDGRPVGHTDVQGRLGMVRSFTRYECEQALAMPNLQATVRKAVERQLRRHKKAEEKAHG